MLRDNMNIKNKCKKCNTVLRSKKKTLCLSCFNNKVFNIAPEHTQGDIEDLIEILSIWLYRLEIIQRSWVDMYDLNDISNYHWMIFKREYCYDQSKQGVQLSLMYRDIKRFYYNYGGKELIHN